MIFEVKMNTLKIFFLIIFIFFPQFMSLPGKQKQDEKLTLSPAFSEKIKEIYKFDYDSLRENLIKNLDQLIQSFKYPAGIAFLDLKDNDSIVINGDTLFPTASAIKIEVLIHLLREYEAGRLNIYEQYPVNYKVGGSGLLQYFDLNNLKLSLYNLSVLMIQQSDNTATNILIDKLEMGNINQTIHQMGLMKTKLQRKMMDFEARKSGRENISTPSDKLSLLKKLYNKELLPDSLNKIAIDILSIPKQTPMLEQIDEDIKIASKGGELDDVRCEMGIFYTSRTDYILVVMTKELPDSDLGDKFISQVSRLIFKYVNEKHK